MAGSTILTAQLLGLAGVTGDLLALLTDKTIREAVPILEAIAAGKLAGVVIRGDRISYSVDGQTSTFSVDQIRNAIAELKRLAGNGGGPVFSRVVFG
jgi:hypothetical protein